MGQDIIDQQFLDNQQYAIPSILQYESVFGSDFVSPGGKALALEFTSQLQLPPGARVLDAGCGLGGSSFVMARELDLTVTGIDLSLNMLEIARSKLEKYGLQNQVTLIHGDCCELDFSTPFDAIYSRDVFLHIHDKQLLFDVLFKNLAKDGKLLFTDYCCGEKPWSEDFEAYVEDRQYCLHTLDEYQNLVQAAGFVDVECEDLTERFIDILRQDIQTIANMDIDLKEKANLNDSWQKKIQRAVSADHRWGLFTARKAG